MSRFKICPRCGEKNPPDAPECKGKGCEEDLMSVPVTDEQQESAKKSAETVEKNVLVRVCSACGKENPPNSRKCLECKEDISDIIPSAATVNSHPASMRELPKKIFQLRSLDGRIFFSIDRENIIIGRDNEMSDYLTEKTFVSRRHCRFTLEGDELFVEDLNSSNSTYVNNKKISQKTRLSKGDEIALGGVIFNGSRQDKAAYFLVG